MVTDLFSIYFYYKLFRSPRNFKSLGPPQELGADSSHAFNIRSKGFCRWHPLAYGNDNLVRHVERVADRSHLEFDRNLAKLFGTAGAQGAAVGDKGDGLIVPLLVDPVERVF